MKIIQLTAENVKKLKVVDITPKKDFIEITGKNGSGKTSVLDSIWWALAGKDAIQGKPIRKGANKAKIRLDLGELVVERRFTESGTTVSVETADGARFPSPQAMLDALVGQLTFDPLEFSRMPAKAQFDMLRQIANVKVDFEAIAEATRRDYDLRRDINRDIKALEARRDGIAVPVDAPDSPPDTREMLNELAAIERHNDSVAEQERVAAAMDGKITSTATEIKQLEERLTSLRVTEKQQIAERKAMKIGERKDVAGVKDRLANTQAASNAYQAKKQLTDINADLKHRQGQADALTAAMEKREQEKLDALRDAKLPVDGLGFGDSEVTLNGLPFIQASTAEQIRASMKIAMAANPKLRIIRIKDGSLLDDESLKLVQEMATGGDYQVWCEMVDTSGKVGIFMEDGSVSAIDGEKSEAADAE